MAEATFWADFTLRREMVICGVRGMMKKEILAYITGLCQAASAALLASAVIVPDARTEAIITCFLCAVIGFATVYMKARGD